MDGFVNLNIKDAGTSCACEDNKILYPLLLCLLVYLDEWFLLLVFIWVINTHTHGVGEGESLLVLNMIGHNVTGIECWSQ